MLILLNDLFFMSGPDRKQCAVFHPEAVSLSAADFRHMQENSSVAVEKFFLREKTPHVVEAEADFPDSSLHGEQAIVAGSTDIENPIRGQKSIRRDTDKSAGMPGNFEADFRRFVLQVREKRINGAVCLGRAEL